MSIPFVKKDDNRGASLVLVIVALLFVGIISVLILTLTVGNANTVDTVSKSSENFYTTENFVDDLKVYLQKFANEAATRAYADQLQRISVTGSIDEAAFQTKYRQELKTLLAADWDHISGKDGYDNISLITFGAHTKAGSGITFNINENFNAIYDESTGVISGIEVGYTNGDNDYSTTIYTDLAFGANMPSLTWRSSDKSFDYDVDKYIIIGNKNVNFGNSSTSAVYSGTIKGSVYAKNNLEFNLNSDVNVYAKMLLAGGNLDVYKNKLKIHGFDKSLLDLEKTSYTSKSSQDNENVWARNINVYSGMTIDDAQIYLEDDLSLDGDGATFTVEGNNASIIAYSSDPTTTGSVSNHNKSGAIVINGSAAQLDLGKLKTLILAGTAYTEVPTIAGDPSTTNAKKYFVQGESITYRALQSLYLVDASKLSYFDSDNSRPVYIGSNPMTEKDFRQWYYNKPWGKMNTTEQTGTISNLKNGAYVYDTTAAQGVSLGSDCKFDIKAVQYVDGGDPYYYVYWNFASVEDAVNFFKNSYSSTDPVLKQKLELLEGGKIILPTGGTKAVKGNLVNKNGSNFGYTPANGITGTSSQTCADSKNEYGYLMKSLSKEEKMVGADLFTDGIFAGGRLSTASTGRFMELDFPASWTAGNFAYSGGTCISGTGATAEPDSTTYTYYLVTGSNIVIGSGSENPTPDASGTVSFIPKDNAKYVVVSSGDVTIATNGKTFEGIVFANGDVNINGSNTLKCFGNYTHLRKENGGANETRYLSEFDALLMISIHDSDNTHANTVLRTLFDVRNAGSGSTSTDPDKDISTITNKNWNKEG